jgi:uncharacterized protein (TIGR02145 family)
MEIKNINLKNLILANIFLIVLIFGFLFFQKNSAMAQSGASDAIAVRIIPNPNHFSAQRWYQAQGFSGSPQSLTVDGYKAVRDGRTVYVSATNIIGNNFYTNIYLISYNQEADSQTVDIFGQIIKNWKFNTNINDIGSCSIPTQNCYKDSDCPSDYFCEASGASANKCVLNSNPADIPNCIIDSDCPGGLFCTSLKAKIVRDLDRLEKIMLIKEKLSQYNQKNGYYPVLGAGTYLSHVAISTWPSWQNSFLNQIGASNVLDPINKLGSCADANEKFNLDTCWNAVDNIFYNQHNYNNFSFPLGSYAVAYVSNPNGSDYKLCTTMETSGYQITDGALNSHSCAMASAVGNIGLVGNSVNNAPYISETNLTGQSGQEFKGFIKATDPEGHPINWSANFGSTAFTNWSSAPTLLNTSNPNQKMIYASSAGNPGNYSFVVTLIDSIGSSSSETLNININNLGAQIIGGNVVYNISYNLPFLNVININSNNLPLQVDMCSLNSSGACFNYYLGIQGSICSQSQTPIGNNLYACLKEVSSGKFELRITGGGLSEGVYSYRVSVRDSFGVTNSIDIQINITATPPVINFSNCLKVANLGEYYECKLKAVNPLEDVNFSTTSNPLPKGLVLDKSNSEYKIKGYPLEIGNNQLVEVGVENEIGLSSTGSFNLNITSNCGNYTVQYPGGPWDYSGTTRNHSGYYKTVLIGNQCWLQDNLNLGTEIKTINVLQNPSPFSDETTEKYCYNNNTINCDVYGGLYDFTEAMSLPRVCLNSGLLACQNYGLRGVCPPGWRVPADSDWHILETNLKNSGETCDPTRAGNFVSGSISPGWGCSPAGEALKTSGFSNFKALLINFLDYSLLSGMIPFDKYANFWTSNFITGQQAIARSLEKSGNNSSKIARAYFPKGNGLSVRCIKDSNQCQSNSDCTYLGSTYSCVQGICVTPSGGGGFTPIGASTQ